MTETPRRSGGAEFIALVALSTSFAAMAIDTMLPALGVMAAELGARDPNDRQLIVTAFFVGLTIGQLVYGPVSDSTGRKPAVYVGIALFILGGLVCAVTTDFRLLLAGRALQGFGAAGPRIVAVAMVRDLHAGRGMARVMSFVTTVFIIVPILAPSIGQAVLKVAPWRAIFYGLAGVGVIDLLWFALRQPETLPPGRRTAFSLSSILRRSAEPFRDRVTLGYMLASGFVFGGLLGYLGAAQQIFQEVYRVGERFPIFFGMLAAGIGAAALVNARLVMRLGMRALSKWAVRVACGLSLGFTAVVVALDGRPPLWAFTGYMEACLFAVGLLFGNYNARAMEPMGHIAGVAAAVVGSMSTLVGLAVGTPIGRAYDGTVTPVVVGLALVTLGALLATEWAELPQMPSR